MDLLKLRQRKRLLELEISKSVQNSLDKFRTDTEMSPESISVYTDILQTIGTENNQLVVTEVNCNLAV